MGPRTRERNTAWVGDLSQRNEHFIPKPRPKSHALTLKLVSKQHSWSLESESVKEICPGLRGSVKKPRKASERNTVCL